MTEKQHTNDHYGACDCEACEAVREKYSMKHYKNREFCKEICPIQKLIEAEDEATGKRIKQMVCYDGCRYTAYEFHQWLQANGYKIVKW